MSKLLFDQSLIKHNKPWEKRNICKKRGKQFCIGPVYRTECPSKMTTIMTRNTSVFDACLMKKERVLNFYHSMIVFEQYVIRHLNPIYLP